MDDPAATLIRERIAEQVAEILRCERGVRKEAEEAIHDMRVALRRLRIALITYRPFLDRDVTDPIGVELKWLGGKLAAARDAEVQLERLRHLNQDITGKLFDRWRMARFSAVEALRAERSAGLLTRLAELADSPPLLPTSEAPIHEVLPRRVEQAWIRIGPLVAMAEATPIKGVRADLLHDVRKAAKRARYAAEPLVPFGSVVAEQTVAAAKQIQTILGEHQDAITAYRVLDSLRTRGPEDDPNAEVLGKEQFRESIKVDDLEKKFFKQWADGAEFTGRSSAEPADGIT